MQSDGSGQPNRGVDELLQAGIAHSEVAKAIPFLGTLIKRKEDYDVVEQGGTPPKRPRLDS